NYIEDEVIFVPFEERKITDDDSLLESDVIDSIGILAVVEFLQEEFKIIITDDEIIPSNLDSVNKICEFIRKKIDKEK
ncbi:MAG: acyl carrier protein, partial [Candidatus Peribacteraceae bacterium]|nr:acyl carrier protein [Candidatus Peribacteraceae bacterium]